MGFSISVCITTCNRPALLAEALQSCAAQGRLPDEVVIGDDSLDQQSERLVESLRSDLPFTIKYKRNVPRLGQNANVNDVFMRSTSSHLVLLHDDDLLTCNALGDLIGCWTENPDLTAAFGKQILITHDGKDLHQASVDLNADFRRAPENAGVQPQSWAVGLSQQWPNDGYMLLTAVAQQTLWRTVAEVGYGGEFEFGLRLGLQNRSFYFLDAYTSKYRLTESGSLSGSSTDDAALRSYLIAQEAFLPREAEHSRKQALERLAPSAMGQALNFGKKKIAWDIYRSAFHPWKKRLSLGGVRRLLSLGLPRPLKSFRL
jgi:GT2 family glycosyltransferase